MPRTATPTHTVDAVRAIARLSRVMDRASGELSLTHYRVLSAIASGDERASRIAAKLALGRPAISASVDTLCQRGLLAREAVDTDQRATALRLTPAGEATLAEVEQTMVARLTKICGDSPEGRRAIDSLVWLGSALGAASAEKA